MTSYADKNAVATYWPQEYGQSAWILDQCEGEGIKAKFLYGRLAVYSKLKKERFLEICQKSLEEHQTRNGLEHNVIIWATPKGAMNHAFAVGIKEDGEDTILTYENAMQGVVSCQFCGKIPRVKRIVIKNTRDEFVEAVLRKGIKII